MSSRTNQQNERQDTKIPDEFLKQLREDLAWRRIDSGLQCLAAHKELFESCDLRQKNAAILLGYFAQWVDLGFSGRGLLKRLLSRFSRICPETLSLLEYANLSLANGLVAMSEEEFLKATKCFETVLALEEQISDQQMISIGNFWMGRCLRRQGRYDDALAYVAKARELALRLRYPKMAAVMRVLEGWIAFQEGQPEEAGRILGEAEDVLADTDDHVTLGNISSAYGRIARRQGNYEQALSKFEKAIEQYNKRDPYNRSLARSFVNIAFVKRLLALQLGDKIDSQAAKFAREALESAKHTQNRRLKAKADIALGLALCQGFPEDLEVAQQCADGAAALLKPAHQDYVWRELQDLKRKLRGAGNINCTLREWSQGIVGNKSFQQVSEEFAAIVIPKVWRRQGCKIARVAARLSISPKKVRRILRDQGLLRDPESR